MWLPTGVTVTCVGSQSGVRAEAGWGLIPGRTSGCQPGRQPCSSVGGARRVGCSLVVLRARPGLPGRKRVGDPPVPPKSTFLLERELGNLTLNQGGPGSGSSSGEGWWDRGGAWQLAEGRTKPPSLIYRFYTHFTRGETEAVRLSHTANRGLTVSDEPIAVVSVASVPLSSGGLGGSVVAQRTPPRVDSSAPDPGPWVSPSQTQEETPESIMSVRSPSTMFRFCSGTCCVQALRAKVRNVSCGPRPPGNERFFRETQSTGGAGTKRPSRLP